MKKGQLCRGKGIDQLHYGCRSLGREGRRIFWKQHRMAEDAEIRRVYREMGLETEEQRQEVVDLATVGQPDLFSLHEIIMEFEETGDTMTPRERAILEHMV